MFVTLCYHRSCRLTLFCFPFLYHLFVCLKKKNSLCILGVAATHGAVRRALERKGKEEREGNACDKVESQANANTNANANAVLATEFNPKWTVSSFQFDGKKRLNAPYVHVDTKICSLKVRGAAWDVRCGIKGKLLELNSRLMEEPELWSQMPASEGWIAVIQPQSKDIEDMMACTSSFQEYITRRASVLKEILALSQGPEIIL